MSQQQNHACVLPEVFKFTNDLKDVFWKFQVFMQSGVLWQIYKQRQIRIRNPELAKRQAV